MWKTHDDGNSDRGRRGAKWFPNYLNSCEKFASLAKLWMKNSLNEKQQLFHTHTHIQTEHSTAFVIHKMNVSHIHWKRLRCLCDSHVVASIRCVHCGLHVWRAFLSPSVDRIGARRRLTALGQVSPANGFAPNGRASALPSVVRVEFENSQHFWVTRKTRKRFRFFSGS